MNRHTGAALGELEHIRQSVADVLTTRLGTRVMRRDYGSQLPELIDQPGHAGTLLLAYAAIAMSLLRWEPRLRLHRVQLAEASLAGRYVLHLDATLVDSNQAQSLRIPLELGAAS